MGLCSSCFKGSSEELITPDAAIRRQQQLDAAERRREQNESRGIKDPEKVRRMQQKAEETARREQEAARMGQAGLRNGETSYLYDKTVPLPTVATRLKDSH